MPKKGLFTNFAHFLLSSTTAVNQPYLVEAINEHVIRGNDAIIKCSIPTFVGDLVKVESWVEYQADDADKSRPIHRPQNAIGKSSSSKVAC